MTEIFEENSNFLLYQVLRLWEDHHDRILKRYYNLSHMQYFILASIYWFILYSDKQVTQTILAKHTKLDPMTVFQILKALEAKGHIYRTKHFSDARAKAVDLTPQGKKLIRKAIRTISDVDVKFFKALGENTKDFNSDLLKILRTNG